MQQHCTEQYFIIIGVFLYLTLLRLRVLTVKIEHTGVCDEKGRIHFGDSDEQVDGSFSFWWVGLLLKYLWPFVILLLPL